MKKYIVTFLFICLLHDISCFGLNELTILKFSSVSDSVKQMLPVTGCWDLSVIPFSQLDAIWASNEMRICENISYTIEDYGCAMTCMSMLLDSHGESVTPALLNDYLRKNNYQGYLPCVIIKWDVACQFPDDPDGTNNYTPKYDSKQYFSKATIKSNLESHNPVIMSIKNNGHFIIITGYKNTGDNLEDFTVIDPAGGEERKLSYYSTYCLESLECLRTFTEVESPCIPEFPPAHCFNCLFEPNLGEIDEDCGGVCPPCETNRYKKTYKTSGDLLSDNIANHIIEIVSDGSTLSIDGEKKFICSKEIVIQQDVTIPYGSDISFTISGNRNALTRDCDDWCIFIPNVTTGNYYVRVTNIGYIDFVLYDRWGAEVRSYHNSIFSDGTFLLFDISALSDGTYYYLADFYPCNNYIPEYRQGSISKVSLLKNLSKEDPQHQDSTKQLLDSTMPILTYPNPNNGLLTIMTNQVGGQEISIEFFTSLGLSVFHKSLNTTYSRIDISKFPKGNYIRKISLPNGIYTRKIIKI